MDVSACIIRRTAIRFFFFFFFVWFNPKKERKCDARATHVSCDRKKWCDPLDVSFVFNFECLTFNLGRKQICTSESLHVSKMALRSITNPNCFDTCCVCEQFAIAYNDVNFRVCVWIKLSIGNHLKQIKWT